jgi:hypothetical protein
VKLATPSFVFVGFLASLNACTSGSPTSPEGVRVEYAEVASGSPIRHLYSAEGTPRELEVKSSVVMHGSVFRVVEVPDQGSFFGLVTPEDTKDKSGPTHDEFMFRLSKADGAAFTAWTGDRVDNTLAVIFGDQILDQAVIRGPLSGDVLYRVPKSIRDAALRQAITAARQSKK